MTPTCNGQPALFLGVDEELLLPAHEDGGVVLQLPTSPIVPDDERPLACQNRSSNSSKMAAVILCNKAGQAKKAQEAVQEEWCAKQG